MTGRALVVVVGTTRAWEHAWESFSANVLDELGADLALCCGDRDQRPNPFYERAKYIWMAEEPDDWATAYDEAVGDSSWRALLRPGDHMFGGIRDTEHPQPGMTALPIYMRWFLKQSLERSGVSEQYDWLIVTRSDFIWPVPHPDLPRLSSRHLYLLDGEEYGGVCGRHSVVPRRLVHRFLSIYDPVFTEPERLRRRLDYRIAVSGWTLLNVERFIAARLKELGLWRRVRFLPYVPFTVRAPGGPTGWSVGVFDERLGLYVKYPTERERSEISRGFVRDQESWQRHLAPLRGVPARLRLRRAYRERGLYERPFPLREAHHRAYRRARWFVQRTGHHLRRIPGMAPLLDARVRRIERRALRRSDGH